MEQSKFAAIFPVLIGGLINKIIDETHVDENEAFNMLYKTELYGVLENEKTKVWTYSVPKLFYLYQNELNSGKLQLPDQ